MAMTKKEQQEFEFLQRALRESRAWRRTGPVAHDIPFGSAGVGYVYNVHSHRVQPAWTDGRSHYIGAHEKPKYSGSQRGIPMYGTEVQAWRALRYAVEETAARELAEIDAQIVALESGD